MGHTDKLQPAGVRSFPWKFDQTTEPQRADQNFRSAAPPVREALALGQVHIEPDHVVDLDDPLLVVENLKASARQRAHAILAPDAGDAVAADAQLAGDR